MGAAVVAARGKGRFGGGDGRQRLGRGSHAADAGGIIDRADEDEVVVHHVGAREAVPFLDKGVFAGAGVDEDDVGVARLADLDRLAGADGDDVDAGVVLGLEVGQNGVEQAGVGRAGGCGQPQDGIAVSRFLDGHFGGRLNRCFGRRFYGCLGRRLGCGLGCGPAAGDQRRQGQHDQQDQAEFTHRVPLFFSLHGVMMNFHNVASIAQREREASRKE